MDRFEEVLKELGQIINLPLHADRNRACRLNINQLLHVQLEPDNANEKLLIGVFLIEVPAGNFRENIFKEALKYNHHLKRIGTFAYSTRKNQLFYFDNLLFYKLTGEKLCDFLGEFITIAESWRQAIERGQPGPSPSAPPLYPRGGESPLGLRP
jgi:hypothetical protein